MTNFYFISFFSSLCLGLSDPRDYSKYVKFLKNPRPTARQLNTGFFTSKKLHSPRIPDDYKKQKINIK